MTTQSSTTLTTAQVRRDFMDYFIEKRGHTFAPSSPVVPQDDPTLLFTNAGMNQFKDVFLGRGERPYNRAVNTQKCIRAGGKHNDLEDVGKDTYHHTFFEMLGNWSFGDYFKAEAIEWAWDLLTNVWGLDKSRLYVTVFEGDKEDGLDPDTEAEEIWKQYVPAERISRWDKKDNFWEMGDTGPCGPCSEIHFDNSKDGDCGHLVNRDDPRVIEIWNLVFIQFNRSPGSGDKPGKLTPLPAKHVDTGMGLERIARVLQGVDSNYDIDLFTPIFEAIQRHTGARPYRGHSNSVVRASRPDESTDDHAHGRDARATEGSHDDPIDIAYRVIADHIRCLTVAITDGARPSSDGRGYVLRRILRRAVRHAHQTLNTTGAWLHELVPTVVDTLGEAFPELKDNAGHVAEVIKDEEESFLTTLDRGIEYWWMAAGRALKQRIEQENTASIVCADKAPDFGNPNETRKTIEDLRPNSIVNIRENEQEVYSGPLAGIGRDLVESVSSAQPRLSAETAFKLHDTYGFPIDLTRVMAEERGMTVDEAGYEQLMEQARQRSRAGGGKDEKELTLPPDAIARLRHMNIRPTDDAPKYDAKPINTEVVAIWNGADFDNTANVGRHVAVILDRTNHYAEAGGQVGDVGELTTEHDAGQIPTRGFTGRRSSGGATFRIENTQSVAGYILHIGQCTDDQLRVGDEGTILPENTHRQPVMANHTATHLLNFALRKVLREDVDQRGSLVAPDRLRFDFSYAHSMTNEQLEEVERIVNERIEKHLQVHAAELPLEFAKSIHGVRAVFGEKYPDPVRVVSIGARIDDIANDPDNAQWSDYSIEFCGGTHLRDTADAKHFVITHEGALAAGVRRINAITGVPAIAAQQMGNNFLEQVCNLEQLEGDALVQRFDDLARAVDDATMSAVDRHRVQKKLDEQRDRVKKVRKEAQAGAKDDVVERARAIADGATGNIIVERLNGADNELLRTAMDVVRAKHEDSAVMLVTADEAEGKVMIVARVPEPMIKQGLKAGDWVKQAAQTCGGGGGGRPDMAQAGGKDPSKIDDAMRAARTFADGKLN